MHGSAPSVKSLKCSSGQCTGGPKLPPVAPNAVNDLQEVFSGIEEKARLPLCEIGPKDQKGVWHEAMQEARWRFARAGHRVVAR
jgi:hypothetical protein